MLRRISLISLLSFACFSALTASGKLVDHSKLMTITKTRFDSICEAAGVPRFLVRIRYDVDVHLIRYETSWVDGSPVLASGLYMVPASVDTGMPVLSYNHGTRLLKARGFRVEGEEAVCAFFAADGYAVLMPDYVGLRLGEKLHVYHHARTEAMANVDMLRAVKELNVMLGKRTGKHLFISGYSQGGHAAMATHKLIQEELSGEFQVTASAPMSGAYDMSGVQSEVMYKPYSHPGYLPYLLLSYQAAYNLMPDSASYFRPPYDSLLPPLFDGKHKLKEINKVVPDVPMEVVRPELVEQFRNDPDHPLRKVMKENSLVDWKPESPVLLCYCKGDEQVSYKNALVAYENMRELGSKLVEKRHAGRKFDHGKCALYTSIYAKMWFDSFLDGSETGRKGPFFKRLMISLSRLTATGSWEKKEKKQKNADEGDPGK